MIDAGRRPSPDTLLTDRRSVREVVPGFYSALPPSAAALYDRKAAVYDAVVGRALYHRVLWGTSSASYTGFGRTALEAAGGGAFAEAGCGSLLFTARMHREHRHASVLLIDRSIQMLRRATHRVSSDGRLPEHITVLHADLAGLPVRSSAFSSVLCLNVVHVPCDVERLRDEFGRILQPGGRLFASALVRSGRWSDWYMRRLRQMGELADPVTREELCARVAGNWGAVESARVEGNMCYLIVRHRA